MIKALPKKKSIIFQTLAETGMRGDELEKLRWNDIDFEKCIIHVRTSKNGNPRTLTLKNMRGLLTPYLFNRLEKLPKISDRVFGDYKSYNIRNGYSRLRKRIADRFSKLDILKIKLHMLRHYVGTMLYRRYKRMKEVMYLLGHVNVNSTNKYIHYANQFDIKPENFITKIPNTNEELIELSNQGYEYFGKAIDGKPVLRKPKW